tara:strand:- start:12832 stop:13458 length:627 start_codon:yes stop_codon:yes gene_type:complete
MMKTKVTIEKLEELMHNQEYNETVDKIISSLQKDPIGPFVPGKSQRWNESEETDGYRKHLCNLIYPLIEESVYGCSIETIDVKFLRHLKSGNESKDGAFLWHADNHPPEVLNIIIYLTDVTEDGGGMEYCELNGDVLVRPYTNPPGNHDLELNVRDLQENPNFKIKKMTGSKGTVFLFDNCIFHRATDPIDKDRDALLLQVKPNEFNF